MNWKRFHIMFSFRVVEWGASYVQGGYKKFARDVRSHLAITIEDISPLR
jgi:hypothetical protein